MTVYLLQNSTKSKIGSVASTSGLIKGGLITVNGKEYTIYEINSDSIVVKKQLLLG